MKSVFDGDNYTILEEFPADETGKKLAYYRSLGKYEEVELDYEGDIVVYRQKEGG